MKLKEHRHFNVKAFFSVSLKVKKNELDFFFLISVEIQILIRTPAESEYSAMFRGSSTESASTALSLTQPPNAPGGHD